MWVCNSLSVYVYVCVCVWVWVGELVDARKCFKPPCVSLGAFPEAVLPRWRSTRGKQAREKSTGPPAWSLARSCLWSVPMCKAAAARFEVSADFMARACGERCQVAPATSRAAHWNQRGPVEGARGDLYFTHSPGSTCFTARADPVATTAAPASAALAAGAPPTLTGRATQRPLSASGGTGSTPPWT